VWNYFGVEDKSPEISAKVVRDLVHNFPTNKFFVSVGLWEGQTGSLDPKSFQKGLEYTMKRRSEHLDHSKQAHDFGPLVRPRCCSRDGG
jgi:hypothetical protein